MKWAAPWTWTVFGSKAWIFQTKKTDKRNCLMVYMIDRNNHIFLYIHWLQIYRPIVLSNNSNWNCNKFILEIAIATHTEKMLMRQLMS